MGWAHVGQVNASGDSGRWQAGQDTSAGSGVVKLILLEIGAPPCGQRVRRGPHGLATFSAANKSGQVRFPHVYLGRLAGADPAELASTE
jgi:hypothetical protein